MRTLLILAASMVLATMVSSGSALASGDGLGITGSPHDFTDGLGFTDPNTSLVVNIENDNSNPAAWNNKRKEICRVCHIPHDHGAVRYGNQGLLWNHQATTKTGFVMYSNATVPLADLQGISEAQPAGTSKLCLGCHDGVSAINQYDGKTPAVAGYGNGTTYLMQDYDSGFVVGNTGGSLTNNHPISITYDDTNDLQLNDPAIAEMDNGDKVEDLLVAGRLECSTCHDVHNNESVGGTHLLRESTKGADGTGAGASDLCFVCHNK